MTRRQIRIRLKPTTTSLDQSTREIVTAKRTGLLPVRFLAPINRCTVAVAARGQKSRAVYDAQAADRHSELRRIR